MSDGDLGSAALPPIGSTTPSSSSPTSTQSPSAYSGQSINYGVPRGTTDRSGMLSPGGDGADVPLALARARENVSLSVRQLVEHAVQMQSKIQSEMDALSRVGKQSAAQLAQELQETRDQFSAIQLSVQSKDREIDELKSTLRRLRDETETAQRESARERAAKSDLQATLEKRASLSAAEMAAQEQAHASAMQQLSTSHAATFESLKQKHALEHAKTKEEAHQKELSANEAIAKIQRELDKERRRMAATAKEQAEEVRRVQQSMDELLRARQDAERQSRKEIDNARQARAASEARCKTLQGALEATKLNAAKELREMRAELDRTLASLAALEAKQKEERQKPRKLAVKFPSDGSAPVLTRRASSLSVGDGVSADDARIRLLTQQNRTAKRSLAETTSN